MKPAKGPITWEVAYLVPGEIAPPTVRIQENSVAPRGIKQIAVQCNILSALDEDSSRLPYGPVARAWNHVFLHESWSRVGER